MRLLPGFRRSAQAHGDDGFTLLELVVAVIIVFTVMAAMIGLFVGSLRTVTQAKQRQTAAALATQTLERLRALPYDVIKVGVNNGTAAYTADPNIADGATATPRLFRGTIDELLLANASQVTAPLSNHRVVTTVEGIAYTVGVYVTQAATPQPAYNLTAMVTYSTNASKGTKTVIQRSTAYSPSGCLSTATHPFAGPCQASFSALAGITAGSIVVSNPADPSALITGLGGTAIGLELPEVSASTGIEQTTTITAGVKTTAATATNGATTTTSGGQTAATAADSDPSTPAAGASDSKTAPAQTSTAQTLTGLIGTLTATPTTTDPGNAASQVSAGATGCVASDAAGTVIASGQPCASGMVRGLGTTAAVNVDLTDFGAGGAVPNLPPFSAVSVGQAGVVSRAMAGRFTAANAQTCTLVSPPNCAHAGVTRTLGTVTVGSLPPRNGGDTGPAAYTNSFSLTGLKETARAESGTGARPPVMTRDAGTLSYWNGATYTSVVLPASPVADAAYDPPAVSMAYKAGGVGYVGLSVDSVINVSKVVAGTVSPAGCIPLACTQQATSASSLTADTLYIVTLNGVEQTRFTVRTNLGALIAESSYRAAPLA